MDAKQSIQGAVLPPAGVTPNFVSPDYVSGGIIPISALFLPLSTIFLILRLYTRFRITPPIRADDSIIVAAWLFCVALSLTCLEQQKHGNGKHLWDIPLEMFVKYEKWASAPEILYVPATALPKIAILISYLRIFPDQSFRIAVYTILFTTLGYMVAIILVLFFHCNPVAKSWNPLLPGHCILLAPYFWNGVLNVVTDLMVLLVPVPVSVRWKVPTRRKLVAGGVFATGTLTCILSAVRTYFVSRMQYTTDVSRAVVIPTSLSVAETNLAVICGCLMVARPFLRKHFYFLQGSDSELVERTWPRVIDDEQPLTMPITPLEYRTKTSAGFGGINSSAGWIWGRIERVHSHATFNTGTGDAEKRSARAWPLRNDMSPRSNSQDNIIEEMDTIQRRPRDF